MFDRALLVYLRPAPPRILPKLRQATISLTLYTERMLTRYDAVSGAETSGMRVLEQILGDVDLYSLRQFKDDFDRYLNYLLPLQEDLIRHIDPAVQGLRHLGSFVTTAAGGREYLLPVATRDYLSDLPFNQPWEAWETLRPLKLLYSDSPDLSLNAYLDKLRYLQHPPFHVVLGIDAILLVMQYAKYLDTHPPEQRLIIKDYLHRYVLYPALLRDSVTTWLLNQYTKVLTLAANNRPKPHMAPLTTTTMGSFGTQFPAALEEVWALTQIAQRQNLIPTQVLSSLLFATGSVTETYQTLRQQTEIPPLRQYIWMQYLATMGWRNLVFATMALTRTHPLSKATRIWVQRDFHLLAATRFWTSVIDSVTQRFIVADFQEKLHILDDGW